MAISSRQYQYTQIYGNIPYSFSKKNSKSRKMNESAKWVVRFESHRNSEFHANNKIGSMYVTKHSNMCLFRTSVYIRFALFVTYLCLFLPTAYCILPIEGGAVRPPLEDGAQKCPAHGSERKGMGPDPAHYAKIYQNIYQNSSKNAYLYS